MEGGERKGTLEVTKVQSFQKKNAVLTAVVCRECWQNLPPTLPGAWLQVGVDEEQRNGYSRSRRGLSLPGDKVLSGARLSCQGSLKPGGKEMTERLGGQGKGEPVTSTTDRNGVWPGLPKGTAWGGWDAARLRGGRGGKHGIGFCAHIISCAALFETLNHSGPLSSSI